MSEIEELLKDIRARTKEILFCHKHPPSPRTPHVRIANICNDILTRANQALTLHRQECEWKWDGYDEKWITSCGQVFRPDDNSSPSDLLFYSCPFKNCGKRIKEIKE